MGDGKVNMLVLLMLMTGSAAKTAAENGEKASSEASPEKGSPKLGSAVFIMGDSSADCGDNTLFYAFLHRNLSLHPCSNSSDSTLLPNLLAKKIGLAAYTPTFYKQNGSIEGMLRGLNFASSGATIMNPTSRHSHQSLDQQLRQVTETFQLLHLHLGQSAASRLIASSLFVVSFGRDDYVSLLISNSSLSSIARVLVDSLSAALRDLHDANVRRVVVLGVLPLGCAPREVWRWRNSGGGGGQCASTINNAVMEFNEGLERKVADLNMEMRDGRIVFCDVFEAMMAVISNPKSYGFEDAREACCGGLSGCASMTLACDRESTHVWWDLYNPTQGLNSLLADSAWSGQPLPDMCGPTNIQELLSNTAPSLY